MKRTVSIAIGMLFWSCPFVVAQVDENARNHDPDAKFGFVNVAEPQSLAEAVQQLNSISKQHNIGKTQEPLTADEVIGAIRRWSNKRDIPVETKAKFERIAETGMLNAGDQLKFATGLFSEGNFYAVWWLDLTVDNYVFRVRDRTISSRKQTDEEIAMLAKLRREMLDRARGQDHPANDIY
jgi:hypothetical protein